MTLKTKADQFSGSTGLMFANGSNPDWVASHVLDFPISVFYDHRKRLEASIKIR